MDIESNKPMSKDAIFKIASMTKPVVGVAIMMMVEEGKVRLTDAVSSYIPEFKDVKVAVAQGSAAPSGARGAAPPRFYTVPAEREITVRDLLTHTSGLASGPISSGEAAKLVGSYPPAATLAEFIPRLASVPLEFQPGTRWSYSPALGFDTLLRIVEVASGMRADQFLKQRIFDPLGMKDTTFSLSPAQASRVVTMYQKNANGLQRSQNQNALSSSVYYSGGGGLATTAEDYYKFAQMLVNSGESNESNGKHLLSRRSVELMGSVHIPNTLPGRARGESWGLSVRVISDAAARNTFLSNGSFGWSGAFGTHFWVDPKEKLVAILMVQTANQEISRDFETTVMQSIVE